MAKRVEALVKKELLVWARTSAGYQTVEEGAAAAKVPPAKLAKWENGDGHPSVPQLRKLADAYKRPLAVFYLAEAPENFMPLRDLRRLPGMEMRRMSPNLQLEIRRAYQRRALALELMADVGEQPPSFKLSAKTAEDPEAVGARIREALEVTINTQRGWKDFREAWRNWRERIESLGVLVFQATRIETEEASGFAIAEDSLPVMVVNRADPLTRRTFTALHEFVHLLTRVSSVSDISDRFIEEQRPPEEQAIEIFCNAAAAAALMPRADFLAQPIMARYPGVSAQWTDEHIQGLATLFGVSREAIVRRLLTFQRTTNAFYVAKRAQYIEEYKRLQEEKKKQPKKKIKRNMPREAIGTLGIPLVSMILANYHNERLSLSEVSGYLGIKTKHIPKIERIAKVS